MSDSPQDTRRLSPSDLPKKAWWRFAQAIFVLFTIFLLILTCLVAGLIISETDTLVKYQSILTCDEGGHSFSLSYLEDGLDLGWFTSKTIENGRFSRSSDDAKVKIFCRAFNRDLNVLPSGSTMTLERWKQFNEALGSEDSKEEYAINVTQLAAEDREYLDEVSGQEISLSGEDIGYYIEEVHNYEDVWRVVGYAALVLVLEAIVLLSIRGIARYTLVGKFF